MTQINSGWWRCRAIGPSGAAEWLAVVCSTRHPDGIQIELPSQAATVEVGADAVATATYDGSGRVIELIPGVRSAPKAPELWFGEITETAARPPAVNLVAFTGHGVVAGSLLDAAALAGRVTNPDQAGAIRWYPATGEVDQVYVQPGWRRQSIGNALIGAASALSHARDWPRLWGDGQRTELGEQFRNASTWRARGAELTHLAPPMTPE
jgi:GNAT superfamily N-acetyltransferase